MIPGEMKVAAGEIEINAGRETFTVKVTNTGDRPIQVGSHYHFFETNEALSFDRARARGSASTSRPARPCASSRGSRARSGSSPSAGIGVVFGFQGRVMGPLGEKGK